MTHPTRREVIAGAASTAASGWQSRHAHAASSYPNVFSALGKSGLFGGRNWHFIGGDGQEINPTDLQRQLADYHTSAYIGFMGCDQFCPLTNHHMATLSDRAREQGTKLMHLIINAIPEQQGFGPLRTATLDQLETTGLRPLREGRSLADSDTIVLFATRDGKESGLDNQLPAQISEALGNRTRLDAPTQHSAIVSLYAPGGHYLGRAMGTDPQIADTLLRALPSGRSR